jgi:threonine dehydratase
MPGLETLTQTEEVTEEVSGLLDDIERMGIKFETPRFHPATSSRGGEILICDDTANSVQTFKRRGAGAAAEIILSRNADIKVLDVGTAGSHGLGAAEAAKRKGLQANIHTRHDANPHKIERMHQLGANVMNVHPTLSGAILAAQQAGEQDGHYFVHPFNQTEVIAGQGTLAVDILDFLKQEDISDPVQAFYPIGGGGLIAGNKAAFNKYGQGRMVEVIGVEVEDKENNVELCEGTATITGELPSLLINDPRNKTKIITVSRKQVAQAMFELERLLGKPIEGAGAIAYAGSLACATSGAVRIPVVTGANPSEQNLNLAEKLVFCGA